MELYTLQKIAEGTVSLTELERDHPILGRNLKDFVVRVNRCCRDAYRRFAVCLDDVLTLPVTPSEEAKTAVLNNLRSASDSEWFSKVALICDELAAVANSYDADIRKQADDVKTDSGRRQSLRELLWILHQHEGELKRDIRDAVDRLKLDISASRIDAARNRALTIKDEIDSNLTRIHGAATRITGSTADGANQVLTREQIAEAALRRPERVLLFNMAMVVILLILGATVMQYVSLLAFPLLTGFVLTSVIVVNAFYLRSIDKLGDEPFIELMRLALLKFFAPLTRQHSQPTS